jgi:beta-glucosidase
MAIQMDSEAVELRFPAGFRWGAATAAYQIEGAAAEDGRTRSIWDTFARSGRILDGSNGDVADDHYHRYADDVALMSSLGLTAYRFSMSWSRVQPGGRGPINPKGLDFYKRLVDELHGAGIEPWLTLYHWDLPQELEDAGGWPVRDTAFRYAEYAKAVHEALGDRVRHWTTVNEPWCAAFLGYASGDHAPGRHEPKLAPRAAHHLLLAHGLAARELTGDVGIALNLYGVVPEDPESEADLDAVRRIDGLQNRLFLDPVLRGAYPADVLADLEGCDLGIQDGDLEIINAPIQTLGVNYYSVHTVTARPGAGQVISSPFAEASPWPGSEHVGFVTRGLPVTGMGWEVDAGALREVLQRIATHYPRVPLYVAENGAAYDDVLTPEGVNDPDRLAFYHAHLRACHEAIESGVPLQAYFAWSLMDNFEWSWGYTKRFGLVYVDFPTQRRIPKSSGRWYAKVISRGGLPGQTAG